MLNDDELRDAIVLVMANKQVASPTFSSQTKPSAQFAFAIVSLAFAFS